MKDLLTLILFPVVWYGFAVGLRANNIGRFLRHLIGFFCGSLAMMIGVTATVEYDNFFSIIILMCVFSAVILSSRKYQKIVSTKKLWVDQLEQSKTSSPVSAANTAAIIRAQIGLPPDIKDSEKKVAPAQSKAFTYPPPSENVMDRREKAAEALKAAARVASETSTMARWANNNRMEEKLKLCRVPPQFTGLIDSTKGKYLSHAAFTLPDQISFLYENAEGEMTHRDVNVHTANSNANGDHYIEGYCMTVHGNRTFRIDRIISAITRAATGEILVADLWFEQLDDSSNLRTVRNFKPKTLVSTSEGPTSIMFTGFKKAEREDMELLAENVGWKVKKTISPTLDYLVSGKNAGPTKMSLAEKLGILIVPMIDSDDFRDWLNEQLEVN